MTIAAGFVCHEGVLLAADTLYAGVNKRYGRKVWPIQSGRVVIGFAGAGMQAGLERVRDEIGQRVIGNMTRPTIISAIEDALQAVLDVQHPDASEVTQGLFAIRIGRGACEFFENAGGKAMLSPIGHPGQCVGWATPLGQYFLDHLYREPMPLKWARIVASHLIKRAKKYSEYCGGDTHFLEIPHGGGEPEMHTDQAQIGEWERHLDQVDEAMRAVLPDGTANDYTLELRLKLIAEAIRKSVLTVVIPVPTGGMNISTGAVATHFSELPKPRITSFD